MPLLAMCNFKARQKPPMLSLKFKYSNNLPEGSIREKHRYYGTCRTKQQRFTCKTSTDWRAILFIMVLLAGVLMISGSNEQPGGSANEVPLA